MFGIRFPSQSHPLNFGGFGFLRFPGGFGLFVGLLAFFIPGPLLAGFGIGTGLGFALFRIGFILLCLSGSELGILLPAQGSVLFGLSMFLGLPGGLVGGILGNPGFPVLLVLGKLRPAKFFQLSGFSLAFPA